MKKICFVNYDMTIVGGAEAVTATLSNELSDKYEVFIYSLCDSNQKIAFGLKDNIKVFINNESKNNLRIREVLFVGVKKLRKFLRKNKIDVVITMGAYVGVIGSFATLGLKTKSIYFDHGALINEWDNRVVTLFRYFNAIVSKKVVVLTDRTKVDYRKYLKIRKSKVVRIYNSIDVYLQDNFHKYDSQVQRIVSVGRIAEEKGFDMLLQVASIVLSNHPNWVWDVYGDGPLLDQMIHQSKGLGLHQQLHFLGEHKNIKSRLYEYAFLVLPSYREGLPLVLLEGKANGLPLVSFDVETGPAEIIKQHVNGFLIKKYDMIDMAQKIEMLILSNELREQFHLASQENIEKFSPEEIKRQWIQLLDAL